MTRAVLLLLLTLAAATRIPAVPAQEPSASTSNTAGQAEEDPAPTTTAEPPAQDQTPVDIDHSPDEIDPLKTDVWEGYEPPEGPPMKQGAAGDRVHELQATLNKKLGEGEKVVALVRPIYVGSPRGAAEKDKDRVRLVWVRERESVFQIRGDWLPLDKDGQVIADSSLTLKKTHFIELPEQPLKVDGVYGQHTQAAVMLFQLEHNLPVTGEVDIVTLDKLEPMIPTNPLLAAIMRWTEDHMFHPESDNYPLLVKTFTSIVMALIILVASTVAFQVARMLANSTQFLSKWVFTPSTSPWFAALKNKKVFIRTAQFAPALFIYVAAILVFPAPEPGEDNPFPYLNTFQEWHILMSRLGLAYTSLVFTLVALAFVNACDEVYSPDHEVDNPISGVIRAAKRFVVLIGIVLVCAALAGKNPLVIVGGIGAFMAVIMLVFRDYLLGLVASIQIIANKMVRIGDWIEIPKYDADGDVKEISLSLIKVQNFDKTISTIPTNAVLSESFRNWSGMKSAGGRRIKRAVFIDMHSIQVCTPEMIDRFRKIELIRGYVDDKCTALEEYNAAHDVQASAVNSRRLTNIGTFRAYLEAYLRAHPALSGEMTYLVRHLQPTSSGLPIEIYAFCKETEWRKYEAVQADVFDHVLAILPEFGLRAFQEITDINVALEDGARSPELRRKYAEAKDYIDEQNRRLDSRPTTRPDAAVRRVEKRLKQLGIDDDIVVVASGRTLSLMWRK